MQFAQMHQCLVALVSFVSLAGCATSSAQSRPSLLATSPTLAPSATPSIDITQVKDKDPKRGSAMLVTAEIVNAGATIPNHEAAQSAPDTSLGWVHLVSNNSIPTFLPGGTAIAAKVGVSFGIELILRGPPRLTILRLRTRVTHPPITNPATGTTKTVDEWDSPMNAGIPRYMGWTFDNAWELVPGVWRMELLDRQRAIVAQEFTVTIIANPSE